MRKWLRPLTYIAAIGCGIAAAFFPAAAPILTPIATGLAGWATVHPSDQLTKSQVIDLVTQTASAAARGAVALALAPELPPSGLPPANDNPAR